MAGVRVVASGFGDRVDAVIVLDHDCSVHPRFPAWSTASSPGIHVTDGHGNKSRGRRYRAER